MRSLLKYAAIQMYLLPEENLRTLLELIQVSSRTICRVGKVTFGMQYTLQIIS